MGYVYVARDELDAAGVKTNFAAFAELAVQERDVIIDMSAVKSLDGSGLGALTFVYKRLRSAGYHVKLTRISDQPLSVLKKLGIAAILLADLDSASPVMRAADGIADKASNAAL